MQVQLFSTATGRAHALSHMLLALTSGTAIAPCSVCMAQNPTSVQKRDQTEGRNQKQFSDVHDAGQLPGTEAPLGSRAPDAASRPSNRTTPPPRLSQSR